MDTELPTSLTINGVRYLREDVVLSESPSPLLEPYYTVSQICEMTGFSKSSINAAIRRHEMTAVPPNGGKRYRRVSKSDFEAWVSKRRQGISL